MTMRPPESLRWVLVAGLWLSLIGMFAGCSPEKRYEVLCFFFDDVPDPNAPSQGKAGTEEAGREAGSPGGKPAPHYTHKPYAENHCDACHSGVLGVYIKPGSSTMCRQCHDKVRTEHPLMHSPVAAEACLWCHTPHESLWPALLKGPSQAVCTQCHKGELLGPKPPAHQDPNRACLECHTGHGGTDRGYLRSDAAAGAEPAPPEPAPGAHP